MAQLRLLGTPRIEDEDGPITGPAAQRHRLALLALLALAPDRTVARDRLVALLWPETDAATARNRLNVSVHAIRAALGEAVLRSEGDALTLDDELLAVDTCAFEAALERGAHEEAVALYDRPLLEGFHLDSGEFGHWSDRERERLRGLHHGALEALAERAEARGDPADAATWWRRRAAVEPCSGRVTVRLMEALDRAGDRAAALRAAERHTRALHEELAVPPGPDVQALVERLRSASGSAPAEHDPRPANGAVPASADLAPADPGPPRAGRAAGRHVPLRAVAAVAAGFLALATVAGLRMLASNAETGPVDRTVAVLPFRTVGAGGPHAFERALHVEVMTRLTNVADLTVLSETAARAVQEEGGPAAGSSLRRDVRWLVRGDVQHVGERVRVGVRLEDARDGRQLWAETYDAELSAADVFRVQADMARRITDALEVRLTPTERRRLAAVPTTSTAAYELYLQGVALDRIRPITGEAILRRIRLLRGALRLDPEFADAWSALADAYVDRAWSTEERDLYGDSAIAASRRALELDPEHAYAWTQLGDAWGLRHDPGDDPLDAYRRALALQPSNFEAANNYVAALRLRGQLAEAIRWAERAHRLSPHSPQHVASLVLLNSLVGRDDVADAWLEHGREEDHDLVLVESRIELYHRGRLDRVEALLPELRRLRNTRAARRIAPALALFRRDWTAARDLYGALDPIAPGSRMTRFVGLFHDRLGLAYALARTGEPDEARRIARAVIAEAERPIAAGSSNPDHHMSRVGAHLVLGDTAAALDSLEDAVRMGYRDVRTLRRAPVLDPLRGTPRFDGLLALMEERLAAERRALETTPPDPTSRSLPG